MDIQPTNDCNGLVLSESHTAARGFRPRALLVEDHPAMQEIVGRILGAECDVVGIVARGHAIRGAVETFDPDVIVLDVSLPDISGLQVLPGLRSAFPDVAVVVCTACAGRLYEEEAFARGANGFVSKGCASTDLLPAVSVALATVSAAKLRRA
jgi:DNA-binding NarL/FixJ family response regulator